MSKDLWIMVDKYFDAGRFFAKVSPEPNTGCWLWSGAISGGGYGQFSIKRKIQYAHRVSYVHFVGPIPSGLEIDHLCRTRSCVNPDHLEPVTRRENTKRGNLFKVLAAQKAAITHCPRGHPYSGDNLYRYPSDGRRGCRACLREWSRRYYWKKRGKNNAA